MRLILLLCVTFTLLISAAPSDAQTRGGGGTSTGTGTSRDDDETRAPSTTSRGQRATFRDGRVEYITSGPLNEANAAAAALSQAGGQIVRSRRLPALGRHILVVDLRQVSLGAAQQILAQAAPQTDIDIHHLYRYAQSKPRLYAADMIGLPATGGCRVRGLRVGIIDGPVNTAHPSLVNARVTSHSVLLPKERHDNATHGTGVASLIVGEDPSGALRGISPGARLYAATAFAKESGGAAADVERIAVALDWLLGNKVRLINLSFAGPPNRALEDSIQAAAQKGAVMIAAAGNKSSSKAYFPAASASVIAVTAIDAAGRRYRKANQGSHIEFAAPGVDIYVAKSKGANYASGTSFAAPIVTALAAHAMARGAKSANAIRSALRKRSQDLGQAGRDSAFGWGLVKSGGC